MREYPLLLRGHPVTSGHGQWVHWPHADDTFTDHFRAYSAVQDANGVRGRSAQPGFHTAVGVADDGFLTAAADAAATAAPLWARSPHTVRLALMADINQRLKARRAEMVDVLLADGHPRPSAVWQADVLIAQTGPELAAMFDDDATLMCGPQMLARRVPIGPVVVMPGVIAPLLRGGVDAVWALVTGNPVMVHAAMGRPASIAWLVHEIIVPALAKAKAPGGTLAFCCGDITALIEAWVGNPAVAGLLLAEAPHEIGPERRQLIRVDGVPSDGAIVWADADIDAAADALTQAFWAFGAIPGMPRWVLVHQQAADALTGALAARCAKLKPGLPGQAAISPLDQIARDAFSRYLDVAKDLRAWPVHGGRLLDLSGQQHPLGPFAEPTVIGFHDMSAAVGFQVGMQVAVPLLSLVVLPGSSDAAAAAVVCAFARSVNPHGWAWAHSIWSRSDVTCQSLAAVLDRTASVHINAPTLRATPGVPWPSGLCGPGQPDILWPWVATSRWQTTGQQLPGGGR